MNPIFQRFCHDGLDNDTSPDVKSVPVTQSQAIPAQATVAQNELEPEISADFSTISIPSFDEVLRASQKWWHVITERHPFGVILTVNSRIAYLNHAAAAIYGVDRPDELIGADLAEFMVDSDRERVTKRFDSIGRAGRAEAERFSTVGMDGRTRRLEMVSAGLDLPSDQIVVQSMLRDVTNDDASSADLNPGGFQHNPIVVDSPVPTILYGGKAGQVRSLSKSWTLLTGYVLEEIPTIREWWQRALQRTAVGDLPIEEYFSAETDRKREITITTRDGVPRLCRFVANPLQSHADGEPLVILTAQDITEQRRLEQHLLTLSVRIRQHIGQEIHDRLGSHLAGTAMFARALLAKQRRGATVDAKDLEEVARLIGEGVTQARLIARSLVPFSGPAGGFTASLRHLADDIQARSGIRCIVECDTAPPALSQDVAVQLYWIAHEAATNAARHSNAQTIRIQFTRTQEGVTLVVSDDGVGFVQPADAAEGVGVQIMNYRANAIGALLEFRRSPEGGAIVFCAIANLPDDAGGNDDDQIDLDLGRQAKQ